MYIYEEMNITVNEYIDICKYVCAYKHVYMQFVNMKESKYVYITYL